MIHLVNIKAFDARALTFALNGVEFHAAHTMDAKEAEGVIVVGKTCPVSLRLESEIAVDYLDAPKPAIELVQSRPGGDRVRVKGRITDYLAHNAIRLDGIGSVEVALRLPQQSTDYRRNSWLVAEGKLVASLPPDDHNEAGLKGSIVG